LQRLEDCMKVRAAIAVAGLLSLGVSGSAIVRANGAEFYDAQNEGEIVLSYFGLVKDSKGNPVDKFMVVVEAKNANLKMPQRNDTPGHFRTNDVGSAIKGMNKPVDPSQIVVSVTKDGYTMVSAPKVPNQLGKVQLGTFVLDPVSK